MTLYQVNGYYTGHNHGISVTMSAKDDGPDFTAICDRIAEQLYNAKINQGEIPRELYEATATDLMNAVFSGLGDRTTFAYEDPNNLLIAHLRQNVYAFSAAKSLTEMEVFNDLMIGEDGRPKSFAQFRNDLTKAGKVFNISHLEADHSTALASAQIAQSFNEFAPDDYLEVRTSGAENVCPICGGLNGFTRLKSAAIWESFCPPFHPRCNCKLIPGQAKNADRHPHPMEMLKEAGVKPYFRSNPAINKVIYNDGYPYMDKLKKAGPLRWDNGYNMPTIDRIYKDKLPDAENLNSKAKANQWWKEKAGTAKGSFMVKDAMGTVVKFDNSFKNHVFEQNSDSRFLYITNVEDILKDPDEVWSTKDKNGKLHTTYIKYYNDFPYSVQADDTNAFTMTRYLFTGKGKVNKQSVESDRQGILIYRK